MTKRTLCSISSLMLMAGTLLAAPSAAAWGGRSHRFATRAVITTMHDVKVALAQGQNIPPPSGVDQSSWHDYLATVSQAYDKLMKLQTHVAARVKENSLFGDGEECPAASNPSYCKQVDPRDVMSKMGVMTMEEFQYVLETGPSFCTCTEFSRRDTGKEYRTLASILGVHVQDVDYRDDDTATMISPVNIDIYGSMYVYKQAETALYEYFGGAVLLPVLCIGSLFGLSDCDFDDARELGKKAKPTEIARRVLPTIPCDFDEATTLWHFMDMVGGEGEYNDIAGMYYPSAGPSGVPGALDVAIFAATELAGITVDYDQSFGTHYFAKYDDKKRDRDEWEEVTVALTEFSPMSSMAEYGFRYFRETSRIEDLAIPLHNLGDAAEPHHLASTTGWGHVAFEDEINYAFDVITGYVASSDQWNDRRPNLYTAVLYRSYVHRDFQSVSELVTDVSEFSWNDWSANDVLDYCFSYFDSYDVTENDLRLGLGASFANTMGAMLAVLVQEADYVRPPSNDRGVLQCNQGDHYVPSLDDTAYPCLSDPGPPSQEQTPPDSGRIPGSNRSDVPPGGFCLDDQECLCGSCSDSVCDLCDNGDPCLHDNYCVSRHCIRGTCTHLGEPGDSCQANLECRCNSCTNGTCSPCGPLLECDENEDCANGFCSTSPDFDTPVCGPFPNGTHCYSNNQCASLICRDGVCSEPAWPGGSCNNDLECRCGVCAGQQCDLCEEGQMCLLDDHCAPGLECSGGVCTAKPAKEPREPCAPNDICRCDPCQDGFCGLCDSEMPCTTGEDCKSRVCLDVEPYPTPVCGPLPNGVACSGNEHCQSGYCRDGVCADVAWPGEYCVEDAGCHCGNCVDLVCSPCSVGDPCRTSSDCAATSHCEGQTCVEGPIE